MAALTCYTAPGVVFEDETAMKEHYKSEWHRHNLKRKVAGLPPLGYEAYEERTGGAAAAGGAAPPGHGSTSLGGGPPPEGMTRKQERFLKREARQQDELLRVQRVVLARREPKACLELLASHNRALLSETQRLIEAQQEWEAALIVGNRWRRRRRATATEWIIQGAKMGRQRTRQRSRPWCERRAWLCWRELLLSMLRPSWRCWRAWMHAVEAGAVPGTGAQWGWRRCGIGLWTSASRGRIT